MSELSIFNFQNNIIRTIIIDGEVWFVAIDIAQALGYVRPKDAVAAHCDSAKSLKDIGAANHRPYTDQAVIGLDLQTNMIQEPDLYALVFGSKLPSAKQFKNWVFKEVLPTIRKTGQYSTANKLTAALTWEEQRQVGKEIRADFTGTLKDHGVSGFGFAQCTNGIYRPLFGNTAAKLKAQRGLPKKASLRDAMSGEELIASAFAEIVASQRLDANADHGNSPCYKTRKTSGEAVSSLLVQRFSI